MHRSQLSLLPRPSEATLLPSAGTKKLAQLHPVARWRRPWALRQCLAHPQPRKLGDPHGWDVIPVVSVVRPPSQESCFLLVTPSAAVFSLCLNTVSLHPHTLPLIKIISCRLQMVPRSWAARRFPQVF